MDAQNKINLFDKYKNTELVKLVLVEKKDIFWIFIQVIINLLF